MLDKKLILELNRKGHKHSEIALIMGVSRQRIHQILTGYRSSARSYYTPKFKRHKNSMANKIDKLLQKNCKICYEVARVIHHIDHNSSNNDLKNLLPLCVKCHHKIHTGYKQKNKIKRFTTYICKICGTSYDRPYAGAWRGYYCSRKCYGISITTTHKKIWSINYAECVVCSTTQIPYGAKGMCKNCYARYFYKKRKDLEQQYI